MTVHDKGLEPGEWVHCDVTRQPVLRADSVDFQGCRVSAAGKNILFNRLMYGNPLTDGLVRPSFLRRLLCSTLDGAILGVVGGVLSLGSIAVTAPFMAMGESATGFEGTLGVLSGVVVSSFICFLYYTFFHWKGGQSPGKIAGGYKVVNMDGSPLTLRTAAIRSFWSNGVGQISQIATLTIGFYFPLATMVLSVGASIYGLANSTALIDDTEYGRALHDRLAGTRVVMVPEYSPHNMVVDRKQPLWQASSPSPNRDGSPQAVEAEIAVADQSTDAPGDRE